MQDKYNNKQPMSGTWSTLGTLKPAYYNVFFIYYSHQQQIPEFLC